MKVLRRFYLRIDHLAYLAHGRAELPDLTFHRLRAMRVVEPGHVVDGETQTVRAAGARQLLWRRWSGS